VTDGRTDGRIAALFIAPLRAGHDKRRTGGFLRGLPV